MDQPTLGSPTGLTPADSRPADDDIVDVTEALAWQAAYCRGAGSPIAALIVDAVLDDVAGEGALAGLLPSRVRFGDFPGLRIMATVHRLALERRAPRVAIHLPTLGGGLAGNRAGADLRQSVVDALVAHPGDLAHGLQRVPQTNETGRAAVLRAALSRMDPSRPVRLREIGASAGLNLRADHLPGIPALEPGPLPRIVDRIGCDRHPVDQTTTEGRVLLTSYVRVDDVEQFERLRSALAVASRVPARVEEADAADFAGRLDLVPATTTVLWHSALWPYLPVHTRLEVLRSVRRLGLSASESAGLAHVSYEWPPGAQDPSAPFSLVLREWRGLPDDGSPRLIARGASHGSAVTLEDGRRLDRDPLDG